MDILGPPRGMEQLYDVTEKELARRRAFRLLLEFIHQTNMQERVLLWNILNVGCGYGADVKDMQETATVKSEQVAVYSVDYWRAIQDYNEQYRAGANRTFICADASHPDILARYPTVINQLIMRHPEVCPWDQEMWFKMLLWPWQRLALGKEVLVTTYNKPEFNRMVNVIDGLPDRKIIQAEENPHRDPTLEQFSRKAEALNCPDFYVIRVQKVA
ncbi:MAG: hypothetical protein HY817_01710 [Candidatus Abawacabacteria bacterium]|nr:hypothetical protein [Candidatus Abawacabacteria bacterium]